MNTTRAVVDLWRCLDGVEPGVLLETGPFAVGTTVIPTPIRLVSTSGLLGAKTREVRSAIGEICEASRSVLQRMDEVRLRGGTSVPIWNLLRHTRFGLAFLGVHLPELISNLYALAQLMDGSRASSVLVGNEFGAADRGALHMARARGIRSDSIQHGVIDGHYRTDRILADHHWVWSHDTRDLMLKWGATEEERINVVPGLRPDGPEPPHQHARGSIVFFTQPYDLVPLPRQDLLAETMPAILEICAGANLALRLKLHPLESAHGLSRWLRHPLVRLETSKPASTLLRDAVAAVVLDSSVVVDCRRADVPCFGIGWYPGMYGRELEAMGYLIRAATPQELVVLLSRAVLDPRTATRRSDTHREPVSPTGRAGPNAGIRDPGRDDSSTLPQ